MQEARRKYLQSMALAGGVILGCLFTPQGMAADVNDGELAAAIRSAEYPCTHVLNVDSIGDNAWIVQCNSGTFNVSRDNNGNFNVTRTD